MKTPKGFLKEMKRHHKRTFGELPLATRFSVVILVFMIIPIGILTALLFRNMEEEVLQENRYYIQYRMEETKSAMKTNMDSIHMSTRFFGADSRLLSVLNVAAEERTLTTAQLMEFHDSDAAVLERMVANNPLLYSVRVYGINNYITEMMSLMYKNDRLAKLSWGSDKAISGWHFDYKDTSFDQLSASEGTQLVGLVTPMTGYEHGTVGYIEAAMKMETMFPDFYNETDQEDFAFFVDKNKDVIHGSHWPEGADTFSNVLVADRKLLAYEGIRIKKINGRQLMIFSIPQSDLGGTYLGVRDVTDAVEHVHFLRNIFVMLMVGIMILLAVMIDRLVVHRMLKKFYEIMGTVRTIQSDADLSVRVAENPEDVGEMPELAHQLNRMLDRIETLMKENVEREVQIRNAGIKALQNQINAHFIYNVLESVKMLAEIDEEYLISDSITSLGKMLRYSMKWTSGNVSVGEELEYIKNYISLMNLRNDFEVGLADNIPKELYRQVIPKMSLQPIVENAILHGIAPLGEDASIYIKAIYLDEGQKVQIDISDNGIGMSEDTLIELREKLEGEREKDSTGGHGIGLKNVEDRIRLSFGQEYGLILNSEEGKFTKVSLQIPLRLRKEQNIENTSDR